MILSLNTKKFFSVAFASFIIFMMNLGAFAQNDDIYIVSTSDMHGNIFKSVSEGTIGYGNVYTVKNTVSNSIVVDGGDFLGDTTQKKTTLNENIVYAMNQSGYDYALFGEAESKYTYEELHEILKNASFKLLCSNVKYKDKKVFSDEQIKQVGDIKIGVFGVSEKISGNGYEYEDPVQTAYECIGKLRKKGAKVIVALVYSKSPQLAEKIVNDNKNISVAVEGGTHTERKNGSLIAGRALVTDTGANGNAVNVTKLQFTNDQLSSFATTNYNLRNIEDEYPEKTELEEKMKAAQNDITAVSKNVVGKLPEELLFDENAYSSSTVLGNFLCDVIKQKTKADVVILNSANITGGFKKEVTQEQINNLFEKNKTVSVRTINGESLYKVMEIAVNKVVAQKDGSIDVKKSVSDKFMQVSGITAKYNPKNEVGKRIIELYVGNKKITWYNDNDTYTIASTQDVFDGANQYLAELEVKENFGDVSDVMLDYLKNSKETVKLSDEKRVEKTDTQKQYWWVIGLIAVGFIIVVIIIFIIARVIMFFAR